MAKEKAQGTEVVNPQPSQELEVPKARVLAEVFAPNGKIRVELLPEGAGGSAEGGSVDLQPLEKRVAALEAKPESEHVDLNPLSERVAALENAPKVADKSQEVTALQGDVSILQGGISTLQGVVSEHATNIASNDRRITALESRPVPESVNLQPLTERVEALENRPVADLSDLETRFTALNGTVQGYSQRLNNIEEGAKDNLTKSTLRIGYTNKSLLSLTEEFYNAGVLLGDSCGDLMRLEDGRFLYQIDSDKDNRDEDGEPYLVFACVQDGLVYRIYSRSIYKEFNSQYSLKIGIYGRIPGAGMYHLRNDYYGSSDSQGIDWKIVKTIPAATPVAEQIKKLLGLS